ncbi:MAG: cytidine deaminase [Planctomycetales bacterium]|nr:cytidine deaminase [Planctomycetales bacterium]
MEKAEIDRLCEAALQAQQNAYAPYSRFAVGAAAMSPDDQLFSGCNIENASYGLTICAERVALFNAIAHGHRKLKAIAVVTAGGHHPCGACRQVIAEFMGSNAPIFICDSAQPDDPIRWTSIEKLLPGRFALPTDQLEEGR